MASKKYDVVFITGKYTDRDGNEKARFANIGAVISTDKGFRLKLETVPVNWDGWAMLKEPQPRDQQAPAQQQTAPVNSPADPSDDIPF